MILHRWLGGSKTSYIRSGLLHPRSDPLKIFWKIFENLQKFSKIFGKFSKIFGKFFKIFQNISQNFQKIFQKFSKIVHNFSKNGYVVPPSWSSPPATFKITDLGDSKAYLQKEDLKKITLEAIATETPADAA